MEENFEKKSSKKFLRVLIPIILVILILVGGFAYSRITTNPKNVFKKTVEKAFASIEVKEDSKKAKSNLEITASLNSEDTNIKEIQKYIDTLKITLEEEIDLQKEIMKYNAKVDYENEKFIDIDMILQNKTIYLYAKDFFSKYIEISSEELDMEEFTYLLEETLKTSNKVSKEETNKLINEIEKSVLEFLAGKEYISEKQEITLAGEAVNTTKSTLTLNEKETVELIIKILEVLKENQYFIDLTATSGMDVKEEIQSIIQELENVEATEGSALTISLYTKGFIAELVKIEAIMEEYDEEILSITYSKESKEKSIVELAVEEESLKLEINKKDKNNTEYKLILPEGFEGIELSLEHKKEGDNKGTISLIIKLSEIYATELGVQEDIEAKLKIKYETDYNATIEEENVENAITINEFTEQDEQELLNNIQNSKLYEIISMFM